MKLIDTVWMRNGLKKEDDIRIKLRLPRVWSEENPDSETDCVKM
jgi:hypothetical protein